MKCFLSALFVLAWTAAAQDPARELARILEQKGVLTGAEFARVEAAGDGGALSALTALLYQKGILTREELARVGGPGAPETDAHFVPAVATASVSAAATAPAAQGAPHQAAAPVAPVTSASRLPLQIYGTLLWNSFYNTAGTNIEDIPLFGTKRGTDPYGNFGMTARQSRFGVRYEGPEFAGAKLSGNVELDLFGGSATLPNGVNMDLVRLRLAYGRLDWSHTSIEAGQDWAVFSPLNPTSLASFAVPSMAASGNPWIRSPQFRFEWRGDAAQPTRLLLQLAALDPNTGDNSTTAVVDARTPGVGERGRGPAVESRLAVVTKIGDREATIGLSGHYNRGDNVGTLAGTAVARAVDSWGVNLDYTLPLANHFNLTGEAFAGRALGLFSVAFGQSVLPVGTSGEHGVMGRGGWMQGQINFNARWQMNLAYGLEADDNANLPTGNRAKNQSYMTNLMYKLSPRMTFAWEWRRFLTNYRNQSTANAIGDTANMAIAYMF